MDFQSIVIYLGLALVTFFIAKYAELTGSKRAVWLIVLLFSLVAGLRAISVGIDTKTYHTIFTHVSNGNIENIFGIEKGFIYICEVLLRVWDSNQFLLFMFGLISYALCIFRFWKHREYIAFRWAVLFYCVLFFAFSLNGLRQFVAASIVFFATGFIKEGKYIKFAIAILIAVQFHLSAFVGFMYLFFEILFLKYYGLKRKFTILLVTGVVGLFLISMLSSILSRYLNYFDTKTESFGLMLVVKIALLLASSVILERVQDPEEQNFWRSNRFYYLIGLLLTTLSYIYLYAGRVGIYFYLFEGIYIGYLFKRKTRTSFVLLLKCAYIAILLYYVYQNMTSGSNGELPYRFFWQN